MNMLQMSEAMRDGRSISLKSQTQLIIALSIPAILEQLVMTLMSYIDTAMVGSGAGSHGGHRRGSQLHLANERPDQRHCRGLFRPDRPIPGSRTGRRQPGTSCASPSCLTFCSVWSWPQQPSASGRSCRSFWALIRRSPRRPGPTSVRWPSSSRFPWPPPCTPASCGAAETSCCPAS